MSKFTPATITQLVNQQNPVQIMISLAWLSKSEIKSFLKANNLPFSHNYDKNIATARLALLGVLALLPDNTQFNNLLTGWFFGADYIVRNTNASYENVNNIVRVHKWQPIASNRSNAVVTVDAQLI